jgi:FkbH-like protein
MREILAETNLLPANVVFIDDNPVQRAAMAEAYPEMRVLGEDLYYNRRILLWSPETQDTTVTEESSRRTEMIQAQSRRETARKSLSSDEFLTTLGLRLSFGRIGDEDDGAFARCFELLNKTNQFNTTGERWSLPDMQDFFRDDGAVIYASAKDRFTAYGVVFVALVREGVIVQAVMSCRVVGMGVEQAALSAICGEIRRSYAGDIIGRAIETPKNLLSRDLFPACGFEAETDGCSWRLPRAGVDAPAHIEIEPIPRT